jgi:hypothetical protein
MREVKCLFADNSDVDRARYRREIAAAWKELDTGVPIIIDEVTSPEDARLKLESSGPYQIFVVDILYGLKDDDALGIQLIKDASADVNLVVIALSNGSLDDETEAKEAGVYEFIPKKLFAKASARKRLGNAMFLGLRSKGHDPVPTESVPLRYDIRNLQLKAVVESIKEDNITALVLKLLKKPIRELDVSFVTSGLSGASVLRVDCGLRGDQDEVPDARKILLKVARDKELLMGEFLKRQDNYSGFGSLFVQFIDRSPEDAESHGWYALGAEFKDSAKTLIDWLIVETRRADEIHFSLGLLFLGQGLKEVYSKTMRNFEKSPARCLCDLLSPSRAARVGLALEQLRELAVGRGVKEPFNSDIVLRFITSCRVGEMDEADVPLGTRICRNHGDLHGRNIIVSQNGLPKLIDPANIEQGHWAADMARIAADLIVAGIDAGIESHKWNRINAWREIAQSIAVRQKVAATKAGGNLGVLTALNWITDHLMEIHPQDKFNAVAEWEFTLAIAVEFLRSAYRIDLPSPKRVLGLLAGHDALLACSELIRAAGRK